MVVHGPWLTRVLALLVLVLTFGFVRLDQPKVPRLPVVGWPRRFSLNLIARYRGRRDGRLGIPHPEEETAPPEIWKLKQHGDGVARNIASKWAAADARLRGEADAIKNEIVAVERQIVVFNQSLEGLRNRLEARRSELMKMKKDDERRHHDDRWRIRTWFYVPAMIVIFAGEFPLNAVAFNLFGENRWATYAMTAGLAAVLVFCAHALGVLMRLRAMTDRDAWIAVLLAVLPVTMIVAIGVVREQYLEALGEAGGLAILDPITGVAIFVVMNLVIYLGAFALSYLHHDPYGAMIERVARDVRRHNREVRRLETKTERARVLVRWLEAKVSLWTGAAQEAFRRARYEALRDKDLFESFMEAYWGSNRVASQRALRRHQRRARRRGDDPKGAMPEWKTPQAHSKSPTIQLPVEFQKGSLEFPHQELLPYAPRDGTASDEAREPAEPPVAAT